MSVADLQRRVLRLEQALIDLRHQVPLVSPVVDTTVYPIIIIGGQTLGTSGGITTYGIKKVTGTLGSITTQTYDPGTVNASTGAQTGAPSPAISSWPDGIGFGTQWDGSGYTRVIVVNDDRGTMATALIGGASDDTSYAPSYRQARILSSREVTVTKADSSLVSCWSPDLG